MPVSTFEVAAMLVSHSHRFIYTKTLKTAGTSVESYFERFCMPNDEWTESHARNAYVSESGIVGFRGDNMPANCRWWNHMPAALIKDRVGKEIWENYFKFCVVRNPYDKVVSAFYFFRRMSNAALAESNDLDRERAQFEHWLLHMRQIPIDRDKYLIDGEFCLDEVVRYETLAADLERICDRLRVSWEPAALPTFKSGIRPNYAKAVDLYTDISRKIVKNAYAFELDFFKYDFPV